MLNDLNLPEARAYASGHNETCGPTATVAPKCPLNEQLRTLGPAEIAKILGKSEATIRREVSTNPERLPPRFKPPGVVKALWLERVVVKWVNDVQEGRLVITKRKTGRRRQTPA